MTRERALWILENPATQFDNLRFAFDHEYLHPAGAMYLPQCPKGITQAEDEYIKLVWMMMGPSGSYFNALEQIAQR